VHELARDDDVSPPPDGEGSARLADPAPSSRRTCGDAVRSAPTITLLPEALALAAVHNLPVFTCRADKTPLTVHGFKDATLDEATITAMWTRDPDASIGIATGVISNLFVFDVDPDKGGFESLEQLEEQYGPMPVTPTSATGGGGYHYYFQIPATGLRCSTGDIGPGIDTRGDGGYVIAPPSLHKSGERYEWIDGLDTPLARVPEWIIEKLTPTKVGTNSGATSTPATRLTPTGGTTRLAAFVLDARVAELRATPKGSRNDELNQAAFRMGKLVGGGQIDEDTVIAALTDAASGLAADDGNASVARTIRSGITKGVTQPEYPEPGKGVRVDGSQHRQSDDEPRDEEPDDDEPDGTQVPTDRPSNVLTFKTLDAWADDYQVPRWLISEFLTCDALDVIGGAEKSLKSWLLLHCAIAVTTGFPLFGQERFSVPEPGPVLLLTGEGGVDLVHDRTRHLCKMYGVDFEKVASQLIVTADIAAMTSDGFAQSVTAAIDTYDPVLVQLDPLYVYFGEDRDAGNVYSTGPAIHELRRLCGGRALQVAHHFTKAAADRLTLSSLTQAGMREAVDHWLLVSVDDFDLDAQRFVLDMVRGARRGFGWSQRAEFILGRFDPVTLQHEGVPSVNFTTKAEQTDHELRCCAVQAVIAVRKHTEECYARGEQVTGVSGRWLEEQIKRRKGSAQRKRAAIEDAVLRGALRTAPGPNRATHHFFVKDYPLPGEGGLE
jgi:Bifunctional DNA primase/polymerase, N-terminal/AAA domain